MYTNADITIYNLIPQQGIEKENYIKTQIKEVFFEKTRGIAESENGIKKEDNINVYIPIDSLNNLNKSYKSPKEFLNTNEKSNYYTFKPKDIVVKDLIDDDNVTLKELKKKYDDVYTIQSISDNRYGSEELQHFHIIAK